MAKIIILACILPLVGLAGCATVRDASLNNVAAPDSRRSHKPVTVTPLPVPEVTVLTNYHHINADGSFEYKYVLSNGVAVLQRGTPKIVKDEQILVLSGYESYFLPEDGLYRTRSYIADENGYRVTSYKVSSTPPSLA